MKYLAMIMSYLFVYIAGRLIKCEVKYVIAVMLSYIAGVLLVLSNI